MDALKLGPLGADAAERMVRWMSDPEIAVNLGLRSEPSLERTLAWIEHAAADPTVAPFAVLIGQDHVGNVVLDQIDSYLGSARLSIYIGEGGRGRGVGTAAVRAAVEAGFNDLGLNRIWLLVHTANARAIAAYISAGFAVEGVVRDGFRLNGQLVAALQMSVLRSQSR